MNTSPRKDRIMKFDERKLLEEGILLKVLHDLREINQWLEMVVSVEIKKIDVICKEWDIPSTSIS